ncbi:MAG: protein kinase [Gemmatimonadaceae bacterium]|nr:protein kinase [Gemmatimonadaceae bacterium]
MIGTQLGNYRVVSRLGEGGMGTVYRAVDTMLDRDVALKVLRPELARQAALVERFRAEAVALARLRHEHIAALYGLDRQGEEFVMVMEYVSGETLESRLAREGTMNWQQAVPIMRGVLEALGHAHVRGVVHRDIKPANVMVDGDGTVKVMDFGIARLMGENRQTRAGVAIGTPSYMAPEQLRGEDVDGRTDLYAAGALLFELLTGRVAFQADSDYSLMMQQLNEPPPAPSTITGEVPRALDAAVARAMAKKPEQRFATAGEFSKALDEITPDAFSAEPIRDVAAAAAAVVARAPRDWRIYFIGACVIGAVGLGAAIVTGDPQVPTGGTISSAADSARIRDSLAALAPPTVTPVVTNTPTTTSGSQIASVGGSGVREVVPTETGVSPTPSPTPRVPTGSGGTRKPGSSKPTTPATPSPQVQLPVVGTTTTPAKVEPARDADAGVSVSRRVQDLAERCVAAISSNNASRAASLLRGDTGGLMSAINDGRIASASAGSVDVDAGDGRGEGRFSVRISWRTAFGGNKSATARLSAEVSRSGDGWRSLGCAVESSGGIK